MVSFLFQAEESVKNFFPDRVFELDKLLKVLRIKLYLFDLGVLKVAVCWTSHVLPCCEQNFKTRNVCGCRVSYSQVNSIIELLSTAKITACTTERESFITI